MGQSPATSSGRGVPQHGAAHGGIGGVDRHVQRRQVLYADTAPILLRQVRESDKAPLEEGVAIVVVSYIEGAAQPAGHLPDEAEGAAVIAVAHAVKDWLCELEPQVLIIVALHLEDVSAGVGADLADDLQD